MSIAANYFKEGILLISMNNSEYTIDLLDLCRVIVKKWASILAIAFVAAIIGFAVTSKTYESTSLIVVNGRGTTSQTVTSLQGNGTFFGSDTKVEQNNYSDDESASLSMGPKLVTLCEVILTSDDVLQQIIDELNLGVTCDQLANAIDITAASDTKIMQITVTDTDPATAQAICQRLTDITSDSMAKVTDIVTSTEVLSAARMPEKATSGSRARNALLGALLGVVLCAGVIVLRYLLVPCVRTEEDVTGTLGLKLLSTIPTASVREAAQHV